MRGTTPSFHGDDGNGISFSLLLLKIYGLFVDSRLVRIFCANLPSQQARGASYNLLLSLSKGHLFRHRSWCYRLSSSSTSPESIKSQPENTTFSCNGNTILCGSPLSMCNILYLNSYNPDMPNGVNNTFRSHGNNPRIWTIGVSVVQPGIEFIDPHPGPSTHSPQRRSFAAQSNPWACGR